MSHIAQYNSELCGVNEEILKKAAEFVTKKLGGQVSDTIDDYYGDEVYHFNNQNFLLTIRIPDLPQGLAISLVQGRLTYFSERKNFEEITSRVEQTYRVLAIARALSNLGYQVETNVNDGGTVLTGKKETA